MTNQQARYIATSIQFLCVPGYLAIATFGTGVWAFIAGILALIAIVAGFHGYGSWKSLEDEN